MANWSNWMDWGGQPPRVQSLNNLYGPPSPGPGYQWLRPTNPAWYPTPSGPQFPMFNAAGAPNYPMFGPNAGVPNVSVGAGPMPALTWAEQAAAAGYAPQPSTVPRVPMFDAAGNPSSIPRPMFDAAGNPTPITQTYTPGPGVPARPQVPGGATQFKTPLVPNQPSLMPNAVPMDVVNPTRVAQYTPGPGVPPTPQVPGGATAFNTPMFGPGSGRPTTPPPGTAPKPGSGGGGGAAPPSGTGAAGAPTPPTPGATPGTPAPSAGTKYSAFRGANPLNIRTGLSPTGAVGSRLPGFMTANINPVGTGAVGSRLPSFLTNQMSGKANLAAGLGTGIALNALPTVLSEQLGADPGSFGSRTARDAGMLSSLGLIGGVPIAAAAGVGGALGNAVGGSGGLGVANMLREAMGWAPTDDTIGDILGRAPVVGGLFGGGGEEAAPAGPAPLPPTPESLASLGTMAGLDPDSTSLLQSSFQSQYGVAMAQYTANPTAYAEAFGVKPEEMTPDLIAQGVFQSVVENELPAAVQQQGTRQAMLQNAAAYQEALAPYLAPLQAQAQQAASSLANAGPGFSSYAAYAQQLPSIIENQIRLAPQVQAMTEYQNLIDQQSQQTLAQMLGNGGGMGGQSFDALAAGQDQQLLAG